MEHLEKWSTRIAEMFCELRRTTLIACDFSDDNSVNGNQIHNSCHNRSVSRLDESTRFAGFASREKGTADRLCKLLQWSEMF